MEGLRDISMKKYSILEVGKKINNKYTKIAEFKCAYMTQSEEYEDGYEVTLYDFDNEVLGNMCCFTEVKEINGSHWLAYMD
jgi:hypothetical protein